MASRHAKQDFVFKTSLLIHQLKLENFTQFSKMLYLKQSTILNLSK